MAGGEMIKTLIERIEQAARDSWDWDNDRPTMEYQYVGEYRNYNSIMTTKGRVQKKTGWTIQLDSDPLSGVYVRRTD
jgi:hypothetical protein